MAVNRAAFDAAAAAQPLPEGMEWLQRYAEAPESRHLMMMLPHCREMNEWRHSFITAAFPGDVSVDEAIANSED